MLKRIRSRVPGRGNGPWILVSAVGVALIATPFAVAAGEGRPLDGGARNPSNNQSQSYIRETEIIANTSTYGTRQSNKSSNGGGAIYGCRSRAGGSPANNEPCVRASNLANGRAFEFSTGGTEVGRIESSNNAAAPFTTNAQGVATGLNADRVDSKSASEIVADAQAQNRFAAVSSAGALSGGRGVTAASRTATGTYSVTFASSISSCALQATVNATSADNAATIGAAASTSTTVEVVTRDADDPTHPPVDRPFHLTAIC